MTSPDSQRRAVIVAASVLALLAVVGLGVLLTRDGEDELATPTAAPSASPSPTAEPSPTPSPSASPSPSATPSAEAAGWEPADGFLTPEAASAAEQPGWELSDFGTTEGPLLDPCGGDDVALADLVAARDERALARPTEVGAVELLQQVFRYEDEQDAAAALSTYLQRVEDCPRSELEGVDDQTENTVVAEASGPDRLLVRQRYCNPACTDLYTTYALVARSGNGLTIARYAAAADGDPADDARSLVDPLAEALAAAVSS